MEQNKDSLKVLVIHGPNLNMLGKESWKYTAGQPLMKLIQHLKNLGKDWALPSRLFNPITKEQLLIRSRKLPQPEMDSLLILLPIPTPVLLSETHCFCSIFL